MFAELSNYLDEELDDSMCDELERHINGCEPCKAFVASLEATIDKLRNLPEDSPNRAKAATLRAEILSRYEKALTKTSR